MIGAPTPDDAFGVMVELQYAEYFDEKTRPSDFAKIIERGLLETKKMITSASDDDAGFQFLWLRFDTNNLKRAAKMRFLEKKTSLEPDDFTEENGFSNLGNFDSRQICEIIFEGKFPENFPKNFEEVVKSMPKILENSDFREIEFALDRAQFEILEKIANRSNFLKKLFRFIVNSVNFRIAARSVLIFGESATKNSIFPRGDFNFEEISKLKNFDDFTKFAKRTDFFQTLEKIKESDSDEEKLMKIEKGVDDLYKKFIHDSDEGEISTIQIPINYFERRLQNARLLKFVMNAKFHNFEPEKIYKMLENY